MRLHATPEPSEARLDKVQVAGYYKIETLSATKSKRRPDVPPGHEGKASEMIKANIRFDGKNVAEDDIAEVALVLDDAGIDRLCELLRQLQSRPAPDHLHLDIWGCGDEELDTAAPERSAVRIDQLRIVKIAGSHPEKPLGGAK